MKKITVLLFFILGSILSANSQDINSMLNNKHKITFENKFEYQNNNYLKVTTKIKFPKNYFAPKARVEVKPFVTTNKKTYEVNKDEKGKFSEDKTAGFTKVEPSGNKTYEFSSYYELSENEKIIKIDLKFELDIKGVQKTFTLAKTTVKEPNNEDLEKIKIETATKEDFQKLINFYSNNSDTLAFLKKKLAQKYEEEEDYQAAENLYLEAIEDSKKANNPIKTGQIYSHLAKNSFTSGKKMNAIDEFQEALKLLANSDNKEDKKTIHTNLAYIYESLAEYQAAIESYQKAKENCDPNDTKNIAKINNNIANAYTQINDFEEAIKFYEENIVIEKGEENSEEIAKTLNNAAAVYIKLGKYDKAEEYITKAQNLSNNTNGTSSLLNNLANIYFQKGQINKAIETYKKIAESEEEDNAKSRAIALHNIGQIYFNQEDYVNSANYLKKSNEITKKENIFYLSSKNDYLLSEIIANTASCRNEFAEYKKLINRKNTVAELVNDFEDKYVITASKEDLVAQISKKDAEIIKNKEKIEKQEIEKQNLLLEKEIAITKNKNKKRIIWGLSVFIVLILLITIFAILQLIQKRKANKKLEEKNVQISQQNEEIIAQSEELLDKNTKITKMHNNLQIQKDKIELQNTKIKSSINYAKSIQTAMLPNPQIIQKNLENYFVFYQPRDIVSGDFYWLSELNKDEYLFAAADCTGHGVPGAMMSMLGIGLLNEIVNEQKITTPSEILYKLKYLIIKSLHQKEKNNTVHDGMDMALVKVNKKTLKAEFAGAYNPLIIVRNQEIIRLDADDMPVGKYFVEKNAPFTNHQFELEKNDTLYLYSDGFKDQMGGVKNKKYNRKQLFELLIKINKKSMTEQHEIFEKEFFDWKGTNRQVDDVLVAGIKL